MASVQFTHHFRPQELRRVLTSRHGGLARDLLRRGLNVETQAKRNLGGGRSGPTRIDTGRLRSSINTQLVIRNGELAVLVGTNVWYAKFVHDGTGLFGPRHQVIKPKSHTYLRFRPRGSRRWVFAKSVDGMAPNRFLLEALPAARR